MTALGLAGSPWWTPFAGAACVVLCCLPSVAPPPCSLLLPLSWAAVDEEDEQEEDDEDDELEEGEEEPPASFLDVGCWAVDDELVALGVSGLLVLVDTLEAGVCVLEAGCCWATARSGSASTSVLTTSSRVNRLRFALSLSMLCN